MADALLGHCLKVLKANEASDEHPGNDERIFMLSVIRDLTPRCCRAHACGADGGNARRNDPVGQTHGACRELPQVQAHYTGFNKLARTFAAQVEALRKHRTGGKQTVTVQHVNVSDGGQAIVGNVQAGGRGGDE